MKKLMILFAMAMICSIAMAQSETTRTIHGAVVDKNGNPLPGAVVSATNGAETALVNADGTFELEIPIWLNSVTASYAGYKNKKMKPRYDRDMIFRLKPKNRHAFLNANLGLQLQDTEYGSATVGIMAGLLDDWGFYGKGVYGIASNTPQITAGAIKRIHNNIYAYLGAGYGQIFDCYSVQYEYSSGGSMETTDTDYYNGFAFEGGFIFGLGRHFNLTVGYTHICDFCGYWNCAPNISLGYVF